MLAIMGGAVVVGQSWNDMSVFGRAGIGMAIAVGTFLGAFVLGDDNEHLGSAGALAAAALLVVCALRGRLVPLLALGVIGSLIATQGLLATTFTGAVASAIVALLGLGIVVAAAMRTRHASFG